HVSSFAASAGMRGQFAQRAGGRSGASGGATLGKVVSVDADSITVQLPDGSSKIINISSNTKIVKTAASSVSDVTTGTTVAVFGAVSSDGSVNAQNIQIDPQMRGPRPSGEVSPTQGK
ncbi:MAG TPA: hypothetical protein VN711_04635, partial [Candidatus Saccharimonadales bacterium]|nr:hypothetical protein [Candidatus Saccharimonadales bacterium]